MQGSLILDYTGPGARYNGKWQDGFDYFDCWFHYDTSTATGWSEAYWSAGPTSDHANYDVRPITLPPTLHYFCAAVQADNWDWWTRLLVTS